MKYQVLFSQTPQRTGALEIDELPGAPVTELLVTMSSHYGVREFVI